MTGVQTCALPISQEKMLILEDAMKTGKIPKVPVYIDGMIWDINAIHTAYPDFLSNSLRAAIFADKNPFEIGRASCRERV